MSHQAKRRSGAGKVRIAVAEHDGVQVDTIFVDQAELGEGSRQVRPRDFDLPVALGLQLADRALEIFINERGVGAHGLQGAGGHPLRMVPPRRREGVLVYIPFSMIVVPVAHDLIHSAPVYTPRLSPSLLDEVAEERGAGTECRVVDVAVQRLVHAEYELGHAASRIARVLASRLEIQSVRASQSPVRYDGYVLCQRVGQLGSRPRKTHVR